MKSNPKTEEGKRARAFSYEGDLLILEKVISRLKFQKFSSTGFLFSDRCCGAWKRASEASQKCDQPLGTFAAVMVASTLHWHLWFKVDKMLTSLVAQKFKDHRGIDWTKSLQGTLVLASENYSTIAWEMQNVKRKPML